MCSECRSTSRCADRVDAGGFVVYMTFLGLNVTRGGEGEDELPSPSPPAPSVSPRSTTGIYIYYLLLMNFLS